MYRIGRIEFLNRSAARRAGHLSVIVGLFLGTAQVVPAQKTDAENTEAAADPSSDSAKSLSDDNEMRATFGLRPLGAKDRPGADRLTTGVGLPLLREEVALWKTFAADVENLARQQNEYAKSNPLTFSWLRIKSNDLAHPIVELGTTDLSAPAFEAPPNWILERVRADLNDFDFHRLMDALTMGSSARSISPGISRRAQEIRDLVRSSKTQISSLGGEFTPSGRVLRVGVTTLSPELRTATGDVRFEEVNESPVFTSRSETVGQFKGGLRIRNSNYGFQCTSNINVEQGGVRYALTAGHCFDANFNSWFAAPAWSPNGTSVTHNGRTIGTFAQSAARKTTVLLGVQPWIVDASLVQLDGSASGTNLFMWRQPGGTNRSTENYYDNVLNGFGNPMSGQMICMEGSSTYRDTAALGYMQTVCGSFNAMEHAVYALKDGQQTFVGYQYRMDPWGGVWGDRICKQDSGALIRIPSGATQGLVSGLATGGIASIDDNCASSIRFTPLWLILSNLGASPLWARGANRIQNTRTNLCFGPLFGALPNDILHAGCGGSPTIPWEFVPAGDANEAEIFMINNWVYCMTRYAGYVSANAYCGYTNNQRFRLIGTGSSGSFRIRNVEAGADIAEVNGGWAGLTVGIGDSYALVN
jgi:hypothetical protein